MLKKIFTIVIAVVCMLSLLGNIYAVDMDGLKDELDLNSLVDTLEEYTQDEIDLSSLADGLINGDGIDYGIIGNFVLNKLFYEIRVGLKACISILIVIILMAIISSLELEKSNAAPKVASLVGFLVIVTITLKSYFVIVKLFTDTVMLLTQIVEVVAPFMLALLIATGEITTSGAVGPVLLFITSLIRSTYNLYNITYAEYLISI